MFDGNFCNIPTMGILRGGIFLFPLESLKQLSCLKDSHTNFQNNIGIGVAYFGDFSWLYAKK
jgi:hypothetical protein